MSAIILPVFSCSYLKHTYVTFQDNLQTIRPDNCPFKYMFISTDIPLCRTKETSEIILLQKSFLWHIHMINLYIT